MSMFYAADHFINPIIQNSGLEEIDFRICMDFGWITIARLGAAQRFNHIVAVGSVRQSNVQDARTRSSQRHSCG